MNYVSTRNNEIKIKSAQAIAQGIAADGGLFMPESIPSITLNEIENLSKKSYLNRAEFVLSKFLSDFTSDELRFAVENAYKEEKFNNEKLTPLSKLSPNIYMLELWHGPTCAFKDMALQLLPFLMIISMKKIPQYKGKTLAILTATSGDTGKAALEGFKDVDGTEIIVFYPENGVSDTQKLQMATSEGENVTVIGIKGNFDDAQNGVKLIFADKELEKELSEKNIVLSSANSINWGRLVPQIIYYVSAYCDMIADEEIALGDKINVVVPTGNFGNILAAYIAKEMGLPISKFICASNENNVLTDFINTGTYNKNRSFTATISPSMDILISSNLERLVYLLSGRDDTEVCSLMKQLSDKGIYSVKKEVAEKISSEFFGGFCNDTTTKITIKNIFEKYSYLCDTHTAVALAVYDDYVSKTGDTSKVLIASTASPYKFADDVLSSISANEHSQSANILSELTGTEIPKQIEELSGKKIRFTQVIEKNQMTKSVKERLL